MRLAPEVAATVAIWPDPAQRAFHGIRAIIHQAAAAVPQVGLLTETLKWGEPAWLTAASGSGTTLRIGWKSARPDRIAVLVNCRTGLIATLRDIYPDSFHYEGSRAACVALDAPLPDQAIDHFARLAQSYHRRAPA